MLTRLPATMALLLAMAILPPSYAQDVDDIEGSGEGSGEGFDKSLKQTTLRSPIPNECPPKLDLLLLLDTSGSIREIYREQVRWTVALVDSLPVERDAVRVAAVQYAGFPLTEFALGTYTVADDVRQHLLKEMHFRSGVTRTGVALRSAERELFTEDRGGRRDAAKVIVLFTDGLSIDNPLKAAAALRNVRHVKIYVAGVANSAFAPEMDGIAGNKTRVFGPNELDRLRSALLNDVESARACSRVGPKGTSGNKQLKPLSPLPVLQPVDEVPAVDSKAAVTPATKSNSLHGLVEERTKAEKAKRCLLLSSDNDEARGAAGCLDEAPETVTRKAETITPRRKEGLVSILTLPKKSSKSRPEKWLVSSVGSDVTTKASTTASISAERIVEERAGRLLAKTNESSSVTDAVTATTTPSLSTATFKLSTLLITTFEDQMAVSQSLKTTADVAVTETSKTNSVADLDTTSTEAKSTLTMSKGMKSSETSTTPVITAENTTDLNANISQNISTVVSSLTPEESSALPTTAESSTSIGTTSGITESVDINNTTEANEPEFTTTVVATEADNPSPSNVKNLTTPEQITDTEKSDDLTPTTIPFNQSTTIDEITTGGSFSTSAQTSTTAIKIIDSTKSKNLTVTTIQPNNFTSTSANEILPDLPTTAQSSIGTVEIIGRVKSDNLTAITIQPNTSTEAKNGITSPVKPNVLNTTDDVAVTSTQGNLIETTTTSKAATTTDLLASSTLPTVDSISTDLVSSTTQVNNPTTTANRTVSTTEEDTSETNAKPDKSTPQSELLSTTDNLTVDTAESTSSIPPDNPSMAPNDLPITNDNAISTTIPLTTGRLHTNKSSEDYVTTADSNDTTTPNSNDRTTTDKLSDTTTESSRTTTTVNLPATQKQILSTLTDTTAFETTENSSKDTASTTEADISKETALIENKTTTDGTAEAPITKSARDNTDNGSVSKTENKNEKSLTKTNLPTIPPVKVKKPILDNLRLSEGDKQNAIGHGQSSEAGDTLKLTSSQEEPEDATTDEETDENLPGRALPLTATDVGQDCALDILFLLDSSGSVQHYYNDQKTFVGILLEKIRFSEAETQRVALIQFAGQSIQKTEWSFGTYTSRKNILKDFNHRVRHFTGTTYIGQALRKARVALAERRRDVGTIIVLVSDGYSQDDATGIASEIRSLPNVKMYAVALTRLNNRDYLGKLTGSKRRVFVGMDEAMLFKQMFDSTLNCHSASTRLRLR